MSENNAGQVVTPNGWIELRDPRLVAEKHRRPIMAQMAEMGKVAESAEKAVELAKIAEETGDTSGLASSVDDDVMDALYRYNDRVALALIRKWSYTGVPDENGVWEFTGDEGDKIIPVRLETLPCLPGEDYDAILKVTAPKALELMPSFGVDPNPKATTESSDESGGHSAAESPTPDIP